MGYCSYAVNVVISFKEASKTLEMTLGKSHSIMEDVDWSGLLISSGFQLRAFKSHQA